MLLLGCDALILLPLCVVVVPNNASHYKVCCKYFEQMKDASRNQPINLCRFTKEEKAALSVLRTGGIGKGTLASILCQSLRNSEHVEESLELKKGHELFFTREGQEQFIGFIIMMGT